MGTKIKFALLSMTVASGVGLCGCGGTSVIQAPGSGGSPGNGSGGTNDGTGGSSATGGSKGATGGSGSGTGGTLATGTGGSSTGTGGISASGTGGSVSGTGGVAETGTGGHASTGGATGTGGTATTGSGGATGTGGGTATGTGGTAPSGPINVLIWNNALAYGHEARVGAITYLKMRETTDNIKFDTTYAHTAPVQESPSDTSFDASVFADDKLDKYDVVMFLDTTGTTIDDGMKASRRQALQDFIEKKGRGYVGTHSASDTYQNSTWPWYVDFVGANFYQHSNAGTSGTAQYYNMIKHPILAAANITNPWNRKEEWYTFTRDVTGRSGITVLLTCHDTSMTQERPSAWIHEMPIPTGGTQAGRMFYTAFGHYTSAFQEQSVMDMIVAGIKWAAHRL